MFNLEREIGKWKKSLRKNPSLEDGYIEEIEQHLRDSIEANLNMGIEEKAAFKEAVKIVGEGTQLSSEYYKSVTTNKFSARPSWQAPWWMPVMLWNYLKVALRNFNRYKGYSFINIAGLGIGITCSVLVLIYVLHLLSFDAYHTDVDRLYRVGLNIKTNLGTTGYALSVPPLASKLKSDFPQVEETARIFYFNNKRAIKNKDDLFYEDGFVYADNEIFNVLTIPFIAGDPQNALVNPFSLVIPERISNKLFGEESALHKTINLDGFDYKVTGVIKDPPSNTHLPFDLFISMHDLRNPPWMQDWTWPGMFTYVKLKPNVNVADFEKSIINLIEASINSKSSITDKKHELFLQPVREIYLSTPLEYEANPGNPALVGLLITVGAFILLIACFNYINLVTARMIKRSKEVGMRKVLGAKRTQLFWQFLNESFFMTSFAFFIGLLILYMLFPFFQELTGVNIEPSTLFGWKYIAWLILLLLTITIISGFYPSFTLSSYSPTKALKNNPKFGFKGNSLRRVLVISQFVMSIILIFCTIVMSDQFGFMKNKNLGFNNERKLILNVYEMSSLTTNSESIKGKLLEIPSIKEVAVLSNVPGKGIGSLTTKGTGENASKEHMMYYNFVDYQFIDSYRIGLVEGRNFIANSMKDILESCLINESAANTFGWTPQKAIGKKIITGLRGTTKEIIGVVDNFHYRGVQYKIEPLVIEYDPTMFTTISVTLTNDDIPNSIENIKKTWSSIFPNKPFEYFFLDELWNELYETEENTKRILNIFTSLSIVIAAIGLFGLVAFIAENRKKEIGLRKVMGCSTKGVMMLMVWQFIKWIIISNVIAIPTAYYFMNKWLQDFPSRINIEPWIIAATFTISVLVAAITVLYQSIRAALGNPIEALKYE